MSEVDPGHLAVLEPEPVPRRGGWAVAALVTGAVALVLAGLPFASFVAGLPALAAIVLGVVGLVLKARRWAAVVGLVLGVVALIVALVVSAVQIVAIVDRAAARFPRFSGGSTVSPTPGPPADEGEIPALGAGDHTVLYEVFGGGEADVAYAVAIGTETGRFDDRGVDLPRSRTQEVTVSDSGTLGYFSLVARRRESLVDIGCRITVDGQVVAEQRADVSVAVCQVSAG